jgi:phosphoribosylamine--glycine ligase
MIKSDKELNVLVIGGGGREHALTWKINKSDFVRKVYCTPGNGGIFQNAEVFDIPMEFKRLGVFVREKKIDFILVGPEAPLVKGISDYFQAEGISIFGPTMSATRLEGSKIFAKNFMKENSIPTAHFEIFEDSKRAFDYLETKKEIVVKADGLCAGKGVVVAGDFSESRRAVEDIMDRKIFGEAGNRVLIEEKLTGEEASMLVLLNGENYSFLIASQDHKPVFDNDQGPNTGGMGAYAPASLIDGEILQKVDKKIMVPIIQGLKREGICYYGVLYLGLMIKDREPYVLEFNVRFGDPETQVVLPLMESDFMEVLLELERGEEPRLSWKSGYCVDVVLASGGYPGGYQKGKKISLPENINEQAILFHAGTQMGESGFYTSGGRVLNVSGLGEDIFRAREQAYKLIQNIHFEGMHYRRDIGQKEIDRIK